MSGMPEQDARNLESAGAPENAADPLTELSVLGHQSAEVAPAGTPPSDSPSSDSSSDSWTSSGLAAREPYHAPGLEAQRDFAPLYPELTFGAPPPQPAARREPRIPHLGHLLLFGLLAAFGLIATSVVTETALHYRLFGVGSARRAMGDIHYVLGSEAILYLFTFGASLVVFPIVWRKSFMAGLHWNGAAALRRYRVLLSAAFVCFLLALLNGYLMPGPTNAPIDKIFRAPGAAWWLFGFGVTFAPFFEEIIFRGFLLPALSTAFDWIGEQIQHVAPRPLDEDGHPQWSFGAMVFAAVATSIPFALMHAAQTGYSLGPFILLVFVSLVLCWARLSTRSLAASVMIHASYNFMLFTLMMLGTGGFRHLENM